MNLEGLIPVVEAAARIGMIKPMVGKKGYTAPKSASNDKLITVGVKKMEIMISRSWKFVYLNV